MEPRRTRRARRRVTWLPSSILRHPFSYSSSSCPSWSSWFLLRPFDDQALEHRPLRAVDRVRLVRPFRDVNVTFLRAALVPHVRDLDRVEPAMRLEVIGVDPQIEEPERVLL